MLHSPAKEQFSVRQEILERARAIASSFGTRAADAEEARRIPAESVRELLDAGIARVLIPSKFGGYGLDLETWFEIVRAISAADASHGWCASIIVHHAHVVGQFPEAAQQAVWADGPDVAIAASIMPTAKVTKADGGYLVSGQQSAFASGVDHSSWAIVGGLVHDGNESEWLLFLIPRRDFKIRDTWFTTGMRATGSNTIITDNVFVPSTHALRVSDLRDGRGPGAAVNQEKIFCAPFFYYAPLAFVTPMLGAAQGAYEHFREWTKTRKAVGGVPIAGITSTQVRMARAAADLDAAELLLRRASQVVNEQETLSPQLLARSVRDFARASEMVVGAIDALVALSGTAGFASSHPIQRAWRDIHFASMHVSVNAENNYAHFGRIEFGLARDPRQPFF